MRSSLLACGALMVVIGAGGRGWTPPETPAADRGGKATGQEVGQQAGRVVAGPQEGLVGYWKLQGDCRDYSGHENHGVNHGVEFGRGKNKGQGAGQGAAVFNGRDGYVEVPNSDSLHLGSGDFTLCAWVWTEDHPDDVVGDVLDMFDPAARRGFTLAVNASAGGYQGQGSDRHVHFGIDNARVSDWSDCGRPNATSNYVSNSLTVFKGKLYAATTDAQEGQEWCRVYRYEGQQRWTDCGRVGEGRTTGAGPLVVHNGALHAATWTYDWTRVGSGEYDAGRVYRYAGGKQWQDLGRPSENRTLNCAASFKGQLYVGGGPNEWGVFVLDGEGHADSAWRASMLFPMQGPKRCFPHAMSRYNGKLYVAYPGVYAFDGTNWTFAGVPAEPVDALQTHSLQVYQGKLCAGTWPQGKVAMYQGGEDWQEIGRVGQDGTEVNSLVVYNGKLYGGSIPRAEVCRYDGAAEWTSLKRFYSPDGWEPAPPSQVGGAPTREQVNAWSRVTSLTVHDGKLFASIGSCTSSILDAPCDVRGKVYSMQAGRCVSFDDDLGPGWKHLAAVREGGRLKLYVDGRPAATSSDFDPADYDISTDRPLRIGFGQTDYFRGKIAEVRVYRKALDGGQVAQVATR